MERPVRMVNSPIHCIGQDGDPFSCLELYACKLNLKQEAFFQKPRSNAKFQFSDAVWYENKPLSVNCLSKIIREISRGANLLKTYTNHCVQTTTITLLSDLYIPPRHIMSISGHVNEQSLASYK